MSNLLEKASILLTPTAYDDGKILSVKPEEVLGEELVVNGDFATDSDWTKQTSWSISGGAANYDFLSDAKYIRQTLLSGGFVAGKSYKINFEITSGTAYMNVSSNGGGLISLNTYSVGSYSIQVTASASGSDLLIYGRNTSGTAFSIDNVSVKEDISGDFDFTRNSSATRVNSQGLIEDMQTLSGNLVSNGDFSQEGAEEVVNGDFANGSTDWNLRNAWVVSNGICSLNPPNSDYLSQSNVLTSNKSYKLTFDIIVNSGNLQPQFFDGGWQTIGTYSTTQTVEVYFKPTSSGTLYFKPNLFDGSITNVSVKEVGQDWILGTGWSIGENKAVSDNSGSGSRNLRQNGISTSGKNYKITFEADITSGIVYLIFGGTTAITATGTYTFYKTANGADFQLRNSVSNFIGSITNISVIEITDDTNLPRINYEGFSYQDSLGSELVVNGDFATDSDWTKQTSWSISGGAANYDFLSDAKYIRQTLLSGGFVAGKAYKINFKITSGTAYMNVNSNGGGLISLNTYSVGSYSIQVTASASGSDLLIYGRNTSGTAFSIDNVSVKEVLGQEVVPDSGCGSWLFEPQSTNKIIYSEDFTQWNKSSAITVTSNAINSPSGDLNASLLSTTTTNRFIYLTTSSATNSTFSIYVKWKNGSGDIDLSVDGASNYTSVSVISEWTRVSITPSSSITQVVLRIPTASELYVWGAQVEAQSFSTSYIPTNGSTVTRLQDAAFGAGSSDLINSTEGVLYAEIAALANDNSTRVIMLSNGTNSNRVFIGYWQASNEIKALVQVGGVTQVFQGNTSYDILNYNKVAFVYKENDFSLWINGSNVFNDTTGITFPAGTLTQLDFDSSGSALFFGKTKCVAVFKEALTDDELECLTTDETSYSSFTALALANNYTII